jgi:hypothetical protein
MDRYLTDMELNDYDQFIQTLPGTGTGTVPEDLSLLLGHIRAQRAQLQRWREREAELTDAMSGLQDYLDNGGSDDYRDQVRQRASSALSRRVDAGSS